jgi:hypothetical protein
VATHVAVVHRQTECECKERMMVADLADHRAHRCRLRRVKCEFCFVEFPMTEHDQHQKYCGSKSIPCTLCNQPVAARKMEIHMATEHGINPCFQVVPDSRAQLRSSVVSKQL